MSNGTLQQIASKGVQDGHLSIAPETSFFKRTYKRVSNYAIEAIDQSISNLAWGKNPVVQVSRNGDLMSELYLVMNIARVQLLTPGGDTVSFPCNLHVLSCKPTKIILTQPIQIQINKTTGALDEQFGTCLSQVVYNGDW